MQRRSLVVGGDALAQVWLFVVAPLIGGAIAAGVARVLIGGRRAPEVGRGLADVAHTTAPAT